MLPIILGACVLVALTMAIHASGIAVLMRALMQLEAVPPTRVWPAVQTLLRMLWWLKGCAANFAPYAAKNSSSNQAR